MHHLSLPADNCMFKLQYMHIYTSHFGCITAYLGSMMFLCVLTNFVHLRYMYVCMYVHTFSVRCYVNFVQQIANVNVLL